MYMYLALIFDLKVILVIQNIRCLSVCHICALFEMCFSAPVCTAYLVIVSKIWLALADVLYQVLRTKFSFFLTSKKMIIFFRKSKLLIKTLFRIMG